MRGKRLFTRSRATVAIIAVTLFATRSATSQEKVLHSFTFKDGAVSTAGLIFDAVGNLYGTTSGGGAYGNGTVFEPTPTASGKWMETVLHGFTFKDGSDPAAGLIFDA